MGRNFSNCFFFASDVSQLDLFSEYLGWAHIWSQMCDYFFEYFFPLQLDSGCIWKVQLASAPTPTFFFWVFLIDSLAMTPWFIQEPWVKPLPFSVTLKGLSPRIIPPWDILAVRDKDFSSHWSMYTQLTNSIYKNRTHVYSKLCELMSAISYAHIY